VKVRGETRKDGALQIKSQVCTQYVPTEVKA
jgi:hypothetical protein